MPRWFTYFLFGTGLAVSFAIGLTLGNDNINYWEFTKDIITMLLSFGALCIAARALDTFKKQHTYQEKYRIRTGLYNQLINCGRYKENLMHRNTSLIMYHQMKVEDYKAAAEDWENQLKNFQNSIYEMQNYVDKSKFILGPKEYQDVNSFCENLICKSGEVSLGAKHIRDNISDYDGPYQRGGPAFHSALKPFKVYLETKLDKYQ
ncbi:hypothetical protein [Shewanella sp.]|uniref:hypothetical protein n=1 Tax=Shewanella sp. TaxID=50422 RepID=UPI004054140B